MKFRALYLLSFCAIGLIHSQKLDDVQWKYRVVILFGNDNGESYLYQVALLDKEKNAMKERDVLLWDGNSKLLQELNIDQSYTGLILIGKDGGIKLQEMFPVLPEKLWTLIDAMPMRRAELRQQKH